MPKVRTRLEPLLVRPGARYTCFGDGLCCQDIHIIGPIEEDEAERVEGFLVGSSKYDHDEEEYSLCTAADGGCVFLEEDMRCRVHADHGPEQKPEGCRRFPLGLVETPYGGRITTEHRCPCRTMGDRPELTADAVVSSLRDDGGDLYAERDVKHVFLRRPSRKGSKRDRKRARRRERIDFDAWLEIEAPLLTDLRKGRAPWTVLADYGEPFPKLRGSSWREVAMELIDARDGTRYGVASAWFGDALLTLQEGSRPRTPGRPWAAAFDRAEARSTTRRVPRQLYADWIADSIWGMRWTERFSFDLAVADWLTRLEVARHCEKLIRAQGARADRAAAEAVSIVETVGEAESWMGVVRDQMAP